VPEASPIDTRPSASARDVDSSDVDVDRLRILFLRLARGIRSNSSGRLTPSQLSVLGTIVRNEQLTVGQIAERERVKPPSVSKIVAALEQEGLVERQTHRDDRRRAHIAATPTGVAHFEEVRVAGRTWLAGRLDTLDGDDVATLDAALPALERLLGGPT
jgi:DNA-binding MarR family transcriptional regulator